MKKEIAELLNASPFVPFDFVLNSGDRYHVADPDMVIVGDDIITVVRRKSERRDVLRFSQLAAIEIIGAD